MTLYLSTPVFVSMLNVCLVYCGEYQTAPGYPVNNVPPNCVPTTMHLFPLFEGLDFSIVLRSSTPIPSTLFFPFAVIIFWSTHNHAPYMFPLTCDKAMDETGLMNWKGLVWPRVCQRCSLLLYRNENTICQSPQKGFYFYISPTRRKMLGMVSPSWTPLFPKNVGKHKQMSLSWATKNGENMLECPLFEKRLKRDSKKSPVTCIFGGLQSRNTKCHQTPPWQEAIVPGIQTKQKQCVWSLSNNGLFLRQRLKGSPPRRLKFWVKILLLLKL